MERRSVTLAKLCSDKGMNQVVDVVEGRYERGQQFKYIKELGQEKVGLENEFYVILEFP